jgi:hypothetical protein
MEAQTPCRSPTAPLDGRYSRPEATKQFLVLHPTQFESTEPVSAQNQTSSTAKHRLVLKINKSFQPNYHPSIFLSQAIPSNQTNPKQTQPPNPTHHAAEHHARHLRPNPLPQPHALQKPSTGATTCSSQRHSAPPTRRTPKRRVASVSFVLEHQTLRRAWAVCTLWEEGEGGVSTGGD